MLHKQNKLSVETFLAPIFRENLSAKDYQKLLLEVTYLTPEVGQFTFQQGLYFLKSGKVRLLNKDEQQITKLEKGDSFGEYLLFPECSFYPYQVRVSLKVELGFIPLNVLSPFFQKYLVIQEYFWQIAIQRNILFTSETILQLQPRKLNHQNSKKHNLMARLIAWFLSIVKRKELNFWHKKLKKSSQVYFPSPTQSLSHWLQKASKRYPFFAQQSASDCGAACLVMITKYWGKTVNINRLRELSNANRDGASLKGLMTTADYLGFSSRPVKATLEGLAKQNLPAIIHWEGKHFIVLWEVLKKQVIVGDPAIGQLTLSRADFVSKWTGFALLLEPTVQLRKVENEQTSLWRFFELVKPHWFVLLEVFLASLFIQIFGLITPIFTQLILDRVIVQGSTTTLLAMGLGLVIFGIFRVAITGLRTYLLDHTANRIDLALITGFINHTLSLPLSYFESRYVGDIISRVGENRKIQRFLTGEALSILLDLLTVFIYVGLMLKYSWKLALLTLTIVPPFFLLALISTPFLQRISREIFNAVAKESSHLIEILTGIRTVKSTATEQSVRWHWEEFLSEEVKKNFSGQVIGNQLQMISQLIETLAQTGLLWFGAYLVIQNQLTIGQLIAFNMLFSQVISPFQRLTVLWNQFQEVNIAVERINDVFESKPEEDLLHQSCQTLPLIKGNICFENVTFRYHPENERNVIENLSFEIKAGQTIALVGRSGSGKTTLSKLILGLYTVTDGKMNLRKIRKDRTVIIIAHRLSTIRDADLILVLDQGILIDSGTHDELMSRPGLYRTLNQSQTL